MNYSGAHYTFPPQHGIPISHQEQVHYSLHPSLPQHLDSYFPAQSHGDYADFGHHASMLDDFEDGGETSTRPRLTKDQVDVLESQFQAQPKPNSNVKRQLAVQTKLTLPRVAVSLNAPSLSSRLTVAELVPEPPRKGQTAEETGRIRDQESNGHGGWVEER